MFSFLGDVLSDIAGGIGDIVGEFTGAADAERAAKQAAADLRGAVGTGSEYLTTRRDAALNQLLGAEKTARGDITTGLGTARGDITTGLGTARGDITDALTGVQGGMQPYLMGGQTAYNQLLAQLGMAPEGVTAIDPTQTAAFQNLMGDITERNREAAAAAGLMGSGVQATDLARSIQGAYTQDYLGRLANLGQMGQQAQQFMGDLEMGAGSDLATLGMGAARDLATLGMGAGQNLANLTAGMGSQAAGLEFGTGQSLADLLMGGTREAGLAQVGAAGVRPQVMGDIIGGAMTGLGLALSDTDAKTNIKRVGTIGNVGWYTWDWLPESGMTGPGTGVLADEVEIMDPDAIVIGTDGYKRIDNSRTFEALRAA